MTYDISNVIQSMIDMRLEEIPHFDLNPETFLTARAQVEVKVKVSSAVLLPVKKNCVNCCLFRCCSTFVAFPASISFVADSALPCTAYLPTCQLACLPTCLLACLPTCLLICTAHLFALLAVHWCSTATFCLLLLPVLHLLPIQYFPA